MKNTLGKVASILAFAIGALAVFSGGRALLGIDPGYYVITWLLLYNYTMGVLTVSLTAVLLWRRGRRAMPAAIATFGLHALIMVILQTAYRDVVASESIRAMIIRLAVWAAILMLIFAQSRVRARVSTSP